MIASLTGLINDEAVLGTKKQGPPHPLPYSPSSSPPSFSCCLRRRQQTAILLQLLIDLSFYFIWLGYSHGQSMMYFVARYLFYLLHSFLVHSTVFTTQQINCTIHFFRDKFFSFFIISFYLTTFLISCFFIFHQQDPVSHLFIFYFLF